MKIVYAEVAQSVEHSTENAGVPVQVWASAPDNSPVGDRPTAGLRTLDPSIGVRIPVPQPGYGAG